MESVSQAGHALPGAEKARSADPSKGKPGSQAPPANEAQIASRGAAGKGGVKRDRPVLGDLPTRKSKRTTHSSYNHEDIEAKQGEDLMALVEMPQPSQATLATRLEAAFGLEYIHEIHQTLLESETSILARRPPNGMLGIQHEVTPVMRAILVDWLIEVAEEYNLTLQTLFLTINYVDRVLCQLRVAKNALQLLGVTAMFIASKLEEIYAPLAEDFVYITDSTYSRHDILETESTVMNVLDFKLLVATVHNFLDRFLRVAEPEVDPLLVHHTHYMSLLSLSLYSLTNVLPSRIAAACVCLTLHTFGRPALPMTLQIYSGYDQSALAPVVGEIYQAYLVASIRTKQCSAREKYQLPKYHSVAEIQPPESLPFVERG